LAVELLLPKKPTSIARPAPDIIVVGNAIEKDATLIKEIAAAVHSVEVVM